MDRVKSVTRIAAISTLILSSAALWSQEVFYTVSLPQPSTRLAHVTVAVDDAPGDSFDIALPMWSPGGYGMTWFTKNVREFHAQDAAGNPLETRQVGTSQRRNRDPS